MRRRIYNISRAAVIAVAAGSMTIGSMQAGEYHKGDQDSCSDCHNQHASLKGQALTAGQHLMKNAPSEVSLCMSCHDGTDPNAPDIVASGTAASPTSTVSTQYTSKYGSSAGFFQSDYLAADGHTGHSLAPVASVTAPLSTTYQKAGGLTCSDCHDPHSSGNYRNLLPDPNPAHPGSFTVAIPDQVKEAVPVNTQTPNPAVAYDSDNIAFTTQSNISAWCTDCHDQLATNATGSSPAHFKGHPSDVTIGGVNTHTDFSNWTSPSGQGDTGFGTDVGDSLPGIPRLRYGSPTGSNTITSTGDTVNCLSCHKAHGSKYKYGLVWPLYQTSPDNLSGCQQCHYK